MHPFFHHLATTLVTLGIQLMIKVEEVLKKENWDVDSRSFWVKIFSPFLFFSYACLLLFAAMLLLRLLLLLRRKKKMKIHFRFSQMARLPTMLSFDYDHL